MSRFRIESFVTLFRLNPARRLIALERIAMTAVALPNAAVLQTSLAAAIQRQHEVLALIEQWRLSKENRMHAEGARETDSSLDQLLSGFRSTLLMISLTFGGDRAKIAAALLEDLFPDGVTFFTRRTFVEQHAALRVLIGRLREERRQAALRSLELLSWVDRLDELNNTFGQQLTRPSQGISQDMIRAADLVAFSATTQVVAVVLGLYPSNSDLDIAGRVALLSPLIEQEEELTLLRTRRRSTSKPVSSSAPSTDNLEEELLNGDLSPKSVTNTAAESTPSGVPAEERPASNPPEAPSPPIGS